MNRLPEPEIGIRLLGREREPVVIIDGFSGMVDALRQQATVASFARADAYYPGIRANVDPGYLDLRRELLVSILQRTFGLQQEVRLESAQFSLVTSPEADLVEKQRIPHYDDNSGQVIAIMHYLADANTGGTAFYRHRRTGFEKITSARRAQYDSALAADDSEYGEPPCRYHHGTSDRYEMVEEIAARPDRLILYRGWTLHSGVIPDQAGLSSDPARGRLTINMFLVGR